MSSLFDLRGHEGSDEFVGFDPSLPQQYDRDKIYQRLKNGHEAISVRTGVTPNPVKIDLGVFRLLSSIVSRHPHRYGSVTEAVRNYVIHGIMYDYLSNHLDDETMIDVREEQRKVEALDIIARRQNYESFYRLMKDSYHDSDASTTERIDLKRAILAFAQDCADLQWAARFRSLVS